MSFSGYKLWRVVSPQFTDWEAGGKRRLGPPNGFPNKISVDWTGSDHPLGYQGDFGNVPLAGAAHFASLARPDLNRCRKKTHGIFRLVAHRFPHK
jgi:hypothetical protein